MLTRGTLLLGLASLTAAPAAAQDDGGLRLIFGIEERLQTTQNAGLTTPSSGNLTSSTTNLSFGLISETRSQVLRLNISGGLRFETGDGAADPDIFDHPSLDALYSVTGANSALTLQAEARRDLLADAAPTPENPDPRGAGSQTTHSASALLDLGTSGPLGLTLQGSHSGTTYDGADPDLTDNRTRTLSATGHLRSPTLGDGRLTLSRSEFAQDDALATRRETSDARLGWSVPLTPILTLDSELGFQRLDSLELGAVVDRTEGLVGRAGLTWQTANGSAGLSIAQSNDPGAGRVTLLANRSLDLGGQGLVASLGATQQGDGPAAMIGNLRWSLDGAPGTMALDLGRTVAASGIGDEVTTDHVTIDFSRPLSPVAGLSVNLTATRIDDTGANLVERMDLTASYTRDLGQDWAMNLGATLQTRHEATEPRANSRLLFLSISRNFTLRP